jgi:pimeloyl-ACP methyl ester carboxylesterase
VFDHIEVAEGRIWLLPSGIEYFAGDLPPAEQRLVWAAQGVPDVNLFNLKAERAAWKSKPSWYVVGKNDRTVPPELERFVAKRMGATTVELESSHVPMLSRPNEVLDIIRQAADGALTSPARRS